MGRFGATATAAAASASAASNFFSFINRIARFSCVKAETCERSTLPS
jgi:hypothetical protein